MADKEWFKTWFDTKYYHILYKNRDKDEADRFILRLIDHLNPPEKSRILDLACGKGRHAKKLHELGFIVTGADLSANSIREAQRSQKEELKFLVHDMRELIPGARFDYVFNLFTSFGYFESVDENNRVLRSIHQMLNKDGLLVIDFMNTIKTVKNLVTVEIKKEEGIEFHISRSFDSNFIKKEIKLLDDGSIFEFTERVQALMLHDFEQLLKENGFNILRTFGNFDLEPYEPETSDRLIIIAAKSE